MGCCKTRFKGDTLHFNNKGIKMGLKLYDENNY